MSLVRSLSVSLICAALLTGCASQTTPSPSPQGSLPAPSGSVRPVGPSATGNIEASSSPMPDARPSASATPTPPLDCSIPLQSLVDQAPAGSTVEVPPCIYRETVVVDKPLTLRGQPGAEIRGSEVWSDWTVHGRVWTSKRSVPVFPAHGECSAGTQRCHWPEQVFVNGQPLTEVAPSTTPRHGEFALDSGRHVVIADDPAGKTLEVTVRRYWIVPEADGIVIEDLRMRHAANDAQEGAITDQGHEVWILNCVLSDTHGAIVSLSGPGGIENSDLFRGGQLGVHKGGSIVSGNRIHDNNTEDFDSGWEAGGLKSTLGNEIVENNAVYDNNGPGIWFDIGAHDVAITGNDVYQNTGAGIYYEISSTGLIAHNVVWGNSRRSTSAWVNGAGILLNSSGTTEVADNIVAWNGNGIVYLGQNRSDRPADAYRGNYIHDNVIAQEDGADTGALAWRQDWAGPLFDAASNNRGANNSYWFPTPEGSAVRFWWNRGYKHLSRFNATPGEDGGSYLTDTAKDAALTAAGVPTEPPAPPLSAG